MKTNQVIEDLNSQNAFIEYLLELLRARFI